MKKTLYTFFIVLFIVACQKSENKPTVTVPETPVAVDTVPAIQWQKSLGGSDEEVANAIQPTSDGGYIIAGYSLSNNGDVSGNHGGSDFWIVKLNSVGSVEWQKSYGGSRGDQAYSVQQTSDGGYIVAGKTDSHDGDVVNNNAQGAASAYWILKLNSSGGLQWQKAITVNAIGGGATDIKQTPDGGFIVVGNGYSLMPTLSYGDVLLIKLNSGGGMEWYQVYGGDYHDSAQSVSLTADGGFIIAGSTASTKGIFSENHNLGKATYDYYIIKTDPLGNVQWQKIYGGRENDDANAVIQTKDGGYLVAGTSSSDDGTVAAHHGMAPYSDYWILKLNTNGTIQWQKSLGCTGYDGAYAVRQTADTGFVIAGYTTGAIDGDVTFNHNTGTSDYWIVKINQSGNIKWQKSYGGSGSDQATAMAITKDGGYVVAGKNTSTDGDITGNHGYSDYWIVKLK